MIEIKPFDVERPWGTFRQFNLNSPVTVKILTLKAGEELSLQSHSKRAEFWRVLSGDGMIRVGDTVYDATLGYEQHIPVGEKHKLIAGSTGVEILEIATGDFLEEKDEIRYEDKYGRT